MSKQFTFCANPEDIEWMQRTVFDIFERPIEVCRHKKDIEYQAMYSFNKNPFFFTDILYKSQLAYYDYTNFNNEIEERLDYRNSPVIEYTASISKGNLYGFGRFYCPYNKDKDFSKLVSTLFRKLKKEFYYCKAHQLYISKTKDTRIFDIKKSNDCYILQTYKP